MRREFTQSIQQQSTNDEIRQGAMEIVEPRRGHVSPVKTIARPRHTMKNLDRHKRCMYVNQIDDCIFTDIDLHTSFTHGSVFLWPVGTHGKRVVSLATFERWCSPFETGIGALNADILETCASHLARMNWIRELECGIGRDDRADQDACRNESSRSN